MSFEAVSGYCPVQGKPVTIWVDYQDVVMISENCRIKSRFECDYLSKGGCSQAEHCPIYENLPAKSV